MVVNPKRPIISVALSGAFSLFGEITLPGTPGSGLAAVHARLFDLAPYSF